MTAISDGPATGLHSIHELHEVLASTNRTDRLGPVQIQNIIDLHGLMAHCDVRKCAFILGIRLKDSLALSLQCPICNIAKSTDRRNDTPRPPTTSLLSRVTIDTVGPFEPSLQDGFRYFHSVHVDHIDFTDIFHTVDRSEVVACVDYWVTNTHARLHPERIVEMSTDGAPEFKSNAFKAARLT